MEMLWKSALQVDLSKGSSNLLRGAAATVGWLTGNVGTEPALEDAPQACENHGLIGWTIDNRGRAQPPLLAVANIHGRHVDRRRLQNAARRIAGHGIGEPKGGPVALAAERGKQVNAVRPRRYESPDGIVDHPVSGIGID